MSGLTLDLKEGDVVDIDSGRIKLTVVQKSNRQLRVNIDADRSITISTHKKTDNSARMSALQTENTHGKYTLCRSAPQVS